MSRALGWVGTRGRRAARGRGMADRGAAWPRGWPTSLITERSSGGLLGAGASSFLMLKPGTPAPGSAMFVVGSSLMLKPETKPGTSADRLVGFVMGAL